MYICICMYFSYTFHIHRVGFRREWCEYTEVFLVLTEKRVHTEIGVSSGLCMRNKCMYVCMYVCMYMGCTRDLYHLSPVGHHQYIGSER